MPVTRTMKKILSYLVSATVISAPVVLILLFSDMSYTFSDPGHSLLKLSIKHSGKRIVECDDLALLAEEAERYREMIKEKNRAKMKLKKLGSCSRERHPVYVELYIDGEKMSGRRYGPGGFGKDGPSFAYGKFLLKPGVHRVKVRMRDTGDGEHFDYTFDRKLEFRAGYMKVIEFDKGEKRLILR